MRHQVQNNIQKPHKHAFENVIFEHRPLNFLQTDLASVYYQYDKVIACFSDTQKSRLGLFSILP